MQAAEGVSNMTKASSLDINVEATFWQAVEIVSDSASKRLYYQAFRRGFWRYECFSTGCWPILLVALAVLALLAAIPLSARAQDPGNGNAWDDYASKEELPNTPLRDAARAVKDRPIGAGFTFSMGGSAQELFQKIDQQSSHGRPSFLDPAADLNFSLLARERLNFEIKQGTLFRTFVEVQDARVAFGTGWGTVATSAFHNETFLDLYQAYTEVGLRPDIVGEPSIVFRVGRQELVLGSRHLFSENDWINSGQSFDLARAIWRPDGFQVDAFAGWPAVLDRENLKLPTSHTNLAGVNLKALGVPLGQTLETLLVYKWDNYRDFTGEHGNRDGERLLTLSGRAAGRFMKHWDYELDVAGQTGERGEDKVLAWNYFAQLGYTFKMGLERTLRLALQYSESSGDKNPHDGSSQTFDPLFGDRFLFHGKLLAFGDRNLDDLAARLKAKVWRGGTIELDYHWFKLNQAADAIYQADGQINRVDPTGRGGRDIGRGLDTQVTHTFHENLSVSGGVFLYEPGRIFKRTGSHGAGDASSLFFMVRTNF